MNITLNIDRTKYYAKPKTQATIGGIRNRLGTKKAETISADSLIDIVQSGFSICPAEMTGTDGDSWKSQQVIIADIDNDKKLIGEDGKPQKDNKGKIIKVPIDNPINSDEALKICEQRGIKPFFMYHTFSNSEALEKYRIVLVLDAPVTNPEIAKDITGRFSQLFVSHGEKAADTTMADNARLIFGGKEDCAFNISKETTCIDTLLNLPPVVSDPKEYKAEKKEKAAPAEVVKIKAKSKRTLQDLEAMRQYDIEHFDLESYVSSNYNVIAQRTGRTICFNPCPICGHNDDFKIYNGSSFCCYGSNAPHDKTGGTIIDFLMYEGDCDGKHRTLPEAMQEFERIMNYDSEEWQQAYKEDLYKRYIEDSKRIDKGYSQHKEAIDSEDNSADIVSFEHPILGELNLDNWFVDDNGVYKLNSKMQATWACFCPVYPLERLHNIETGQEKITLRFKRDNSWRDITVEKMIVANGRKIVDLAAFGLSVNSNISKNLVEYLSIVESLNNIPVRKSVNHFGWYEGDFVPYSQDIIFDSEDETSVLQNALIPKGDLQTYIDYVKKIRRETKERFEVRLVMAASLASVLIKPLNMLPFILNIWGNTGTGKTVDLKLAASIWADPNESRYITDSDSTRNALAGRASILNNLPMMIDDFSKVTRKDINAVMDIIYSLSSGKEKDRLNANATLRKSKTWQNCSITTNEAPLSNDKMRGGALNRILDYEMCAGDIFKDPAEVLSVINENHGVLGEAFIELINEIGISKIKDIRRDFESRIIKALKTDYREVENKQLQPLSIILTADFLVTEYIFKDGLFLNPEEMATQLKGKEEISDGQRAYNDICDYVVSNEVHFAKNEYDLYAEDKTIERWGIQRDGYVHFFPLTFRRFMEQNGHNVDVFCKWAQEKAHEVLKTNKGNQNSISIMGHTQRVYSILLNANFGFTVPDDSEEIPYD